MGCSQTCLVANGVGASEERVWFIPPRPQVWVRGHGGGHSHNASCVALEGAVFGKTARGCYEKRQVLIADPFGRGFPTNQAGRWGRGSPERLLLPRETRYLDLLHHVAELDQEFFRLLGSVRQPVEGLGELALQGEERVGLFPRPDLVLVPEEPTCAHLGLGTERGPCAAFPGVRSLQQPHRGVLLPLLPWGWEKGGLAISSGLPKPWIWDAQTRCASLATLFQEPGKSPVINYLSETSRLLGGCKQHAGFRVEMAPRLQNLTLRGHAVLLGMYEGQGEEVGWLPGCQREQRAENDLAALPPPEMLIKPR